jgi:hypothetical protein
MSTVGWWVCGHLHVFSYGDEDWHMGFSQSHEEPIPTHCQEDLPNGDPCLDSTHLFGPYATKEDAETDIPVLTTYL